MGSVVGVVMGAAGVAQWAGTAGATGTGAGEEAGTGAGGTAGRWTSADRVVPGPAGHDGYDLREVYLDVEFGGGGDFRGGHTAYLVDAKAADDPRDVARFAYRRSHVMLGIAEGHVDARAGRGWIHLHGYGRTGMDVTASGARMEMRMDTGVVAHRPVMFTRAVLLRRAGA